MHTSCNVCFVIRVISSAAARTTKARGADAFVSTAKWPEMSGNAAGLRVQCYTCGNWYDAEDVTIPLEGYIPFMTNYEYCCGSCGTETIVKKPASFIQVIITTLANLQAGHVCDENPKSFFSLENDIIPFVWENWDMICTKRSKTGSWKNNLSTKLATETRLFREGESGSQRFGLVDQDLSTIGPRRYESKAVPTRSMGRMKRRLDNSQITSTATKRSKSDAPTSKGLSHGYPLEHPSNKDGYRYILAEKDPHAVLELDPEEMAGRPIPPELYRPAMANQVLLALHDRASQLRVGEDRMTVTGDKGYCMVRATHGVCSGTWFYEVYVRDLDSVPECAVRLGWSQSLGNLQAPCGLDKLSYSWRSRFGTKFHQSRGKHYSEGYGTGDTLGFLIHLPKTSSTAKLPPTHKDKALIKFKNYFYFEERDEQVDEFEKTLRPLPGSKIEFFRNGVSQGVAWSDIYAGTYFPALSLYRGATVTANFGPNFKRPPKNITFSPAAELGMLQQTMCEMLFHVECRLASLRD